MLTKGPISPGVHGTLGYVLAAVLILTPFIARFDSDTASAVSIVAGVYQLQLAMLTAWPTRNPGADLARRAWGDRLHLRARLIAAPFGIVFHDKTATTFRIALGVGGFGVVAATRFVSN
jgi:hypothetical protein